MGKIKLKVKYVKQKNFTFILKYPSHISDNHIEGSSSERYSWVVDAMWTSSPA